MNCPRCGNEVSQEEAFCGQCGMPNPPQSPIPPSSIVSSPLPQNAYTGNLAAPNTPSGNLSGQLPFPQGPADSYQQGVPPPAMTRNFGLPSNLAGPPRPASGKLSSYNQTGFHHDATEAMTSFPGASSIGLPGGYQQQGYPNMPAASGNLPGQYEGHPSQMLPFQTGNYAGPLPQQSYGPGQAYPYGMRGKLTPPSSQNNTIILIISICLVVLIISAVGFTTLFLMRSQDSTQTANQPTPTTAAAPTSTPTPVPTPSPTPSPTAIPSPTAVPTPPPDAGFAWCDPMCRQYTFMTEYPATWQTGPAANAPGIQFTNTAQPLIYGSFKAPGPTTSVAGDLVASDLQTNYAAKPGYTPPATTTTTTIGGATWVTALAYYTETLKERVVVYSTVYQGKAFIIELQAPDDQFDAINAQFFAPMLGKYQFL